MGAIGIPATDFFRMTPASTVMAIRAYNDAEWMKWQHTRIIAYTTYACKPRKKRSRILSMFRWFPLPNDKKVQTLTDEDKMKLVWTKALEKLKN